MRESAPYSRLAGVYDELVVDPCYSSWADSIEGTWQGDDVTDVLDVCCGTGLMTRELANRGYRMTGVDASRAMLARAHTLLGSDAHLVEAELPDLPVTGVFDAAVSTFDGFNYLDEPSLRTSLAAVAGRLRTGGWLVFDVHGPAALGFLQDNPVIEGEQDGCRFVLTSTVDPVSRTCATTIDLTAPDPADSFTERHVQHLHSDDSVRAALEAADMEVVTVLDEYSEVVADAATMRATWVARRRPAS